MAQYILALDQGTTGTTALILNSQGQILAKHNQEFPQIFPKPGWVEHDPEEIWKTVESTVLKVLRQSEIAAAQVTAIGITNQRETVVVWDRKTHLPVYNAIVWQCRRTTDFCDAVKKKGAHKKIEMLTGLKMDPYFSASKVNWILKNVAGARARAKKNELALGTIDSFLVWRLSGGASHVTDVSNASRTQLMNLKTLAWDPYLCDFFDIPSSMLPEITDSSGSIAKTRGLSFLPDGIPITGIAGDQQAALFGQTCFSVGEAKCTFGTGSFLLLNTGAELVRSKRGLLSTVAWRLAGAKPVYALEGGAFICGAAVQWLRDGLKLIKSSSEIEELAKTESDSGGVEFVPALTGLGAPYWDPEARGLIAGLTRGSTRGHLARATLEAMALQNVDILLAMQADLKKKLKSVKVDGGATVNGLLMQIQADYLGLEVVRPTYVETTGLGAGYLAGLGAGLWKDLSQIKSVWKKDQAFAPKLSKKVRDARLSQWHSAVGRSRSR